MQDGGKKQWGRLLQENLFLSRLIHPPEPTMYDQVLRHLETISREIRIPPKSQLNFGEVALATIAVCLRWGTYFAVLADRTKPI